MVTGVQTCALPILNKGVVRVGEEPQAVVEERSAADVLLVMFP